MQQSSGETLTPWKTSLDDDVSLNPVSGMDSGMGTVRVGEGRVDHDKIDVEISEIRKRIDRYKHAIDCNSVSAARNCNDGLPRGCDEDSYGNNDDCCGDNECVDGHDGDNGVNNGGDNVAIQDAVRSMVDLCVSEEIYRGCSEDD